MNAVKGNKDRFITAAIIIISVVGLIYFGYQAFYSKSGTNQPNPFEYNIEHFKKSDTSLHQYAEIKQISPGMRELHALAIGPEDQLFVAGDQACAVFDKKGNKLADISLSASASALTVDKNSDIYGAFNDHVQVFDKSGTRMHKWESIDQNSILTSIAVTENEVLLADAGNLIVWQYDKMGRVIRQIGKKDTSKDIPGFIIPSPYFDLAVDPDGFLWVANTGRLSLENYTMDGDLRSKWGDAGMDVTRFCGCCNPSHFTILDNGSFVTAEKGIARVKVYNRIGQLIALVAGPDQFTTGTVGLDVAVDSQERIYVLDPMRQQVRIFEKKQK